MELAAYTLTAINYMLFCISRFLKNKSQILACDLLAKILYVAGLWFLGALSGSYSLMLNFFWLIFANIKERKGKSWPAVYAFFQIALIVVMVLYFDGIASILICCSLSIFLFATWWLSPQKLRTTGIVGNIIALLYQGTIRNWAGICGELVVIVSNTVAYMKYRKQELKEESTLLGNELS